ncbi:MAG: hypothetical protein IKJ80_05215 [Clostridia bacterium]|nr:hypothetical protein [Clostridia bacterium]
MKKLLIMVGCAIIAIAMLVTAVSFLLSGSPYDEIEAIHSIIYSPEEKEAYVLYNGEVVGSPIECDKYSIKGYSDDRTVCFFSTTSGEGEDQEVKYYVVNEDEIIALPDNDLDYGAMSADGKNIIAAETTENEDGSPEMTFYIYNIGDQSKTEFKYSGDILDEVELSKNFDSILYTSISGEGEEKTTSLYLYTDGENVKLASDMYPVAVSDNAKYIYAYSKEKTEEKDDEGDNDYDFSFDLTSSTKYTLYMLTKDGEKTKIADEFDRYSQSFNKDMSQMLFTAADKAYFYENGGEKVKIANNADSIYAMTPSAVASLEDFCGAPVIIYNSSSSSASIYRVEDNEAAIEKLASDVSSRYRYLTNDGETIYFLKNGSLRRISVDDASSDEILVKDGVIRILVSNDGENVYIVDKDDTLYYVDDSGETSRVADDVESVEMTIDGIVLYTDEDDVLYYTEDGDKGEKIADDVCEFEVTLGTVIYFADKNSSTGHASAFIGDDGTSFENVASGKEFRRISADYDYDY